MPYQIYLPPPTIPGMEPADGSASGDRRLSGSSLSSGDNPWVKKCPHGSGKEVPATPPSGDYSAGASSDDLAAGSESNLSIVVLLA